MSTMQLTSDAYRLSLPAMPNEKDPRVILPMPRELLQAVDDFRFDNRIDSRAEAIRQLLRRGLDAAAKEAPAPKREAKRSA
jgi:metal-responsive CopG/Arc/MetJ family transcriptional regulator